jgi:hypothetical protein
LNCTGFPYGFVSFVGCGSPDVFILAEVRRMAVGHHGAV